MRSFSFIFLALLNISLFSELSHADGRRCPRIIASKSTGYYLRGRDFECFRRTRKAFAAGYRSEALAKESKMLSRFVHSGSAMSNTPVFSVLSSAKIVVEYPGTSRFVVEVREARTGDYVERLFDISAPTTEPLVTYFSRPGDFYIHIRTEQGEAPWRVTLESE